MFKKILNFCSSILFIYFEQKKETKYKTNKNFNFFFLSGFLRSVKMWQLFSD